MSDDLSIGIILWLLVKMSQVKYVLILLVVMHLYINCDFFKSILLTEPFKKV